VRIMILRRRRGGKYFVGGSAKGNTWLGVERNVWRQQFPVQHWYLAVKLHKLHFLDVCPSLKF
jgi:hypothetical protein